MRCKFILLINNIEAKYDLFLIVIFTLCNISLSFHVLNISCITKQIKLFEPQIEMIKMIVYITGS